jgi:hypothetical protein
MMSSAEDWKVETWGIKTGGSKKVDINPKI